MHLIFSDNPALVVDLKKLKYKEEKYYDQGEKVENLKKNMKMNILEMSKGEDAKFLKEFFHTRAPKFSKFVQDMGIKGDTLTYDQFNEVLK